jgi:transporter family protein
VIVTSTWQLWAVLSAVFAALTAIFAKVGVENVNADFATFIRTVVILVTLAFILLATGQFQSLGAISSRSYLFLLLSGLATGASWICYFRALKIGEAAKVAPIDKLSVVLVALFGAVFLGERLTTPNWLGVALIERLLDRQEVAPRKSFLQRATEQEGRMERRHGADFALTSFKGEPSSPCFGDTLFDTEKRLCGRTAEANQDVRVGKLDLPQDEGKADLRFLRGRRAVSWWTPGYDVGDVHRRPIESDRRQHAVKQFAGSADERQTFNVFVATRRLPYEHQSCFGIAVGEYELARRRFQRAAFKVIENGTQLVECLCVFCRRTCLHDGRIRGRRRSKRGPAHSVEIGRRGRRSRRTRGRRRRLSRSKTIDGTFS